MGNQTNILESELFCLEAERFNSKRQVASMDSDFLLERIENGGLSFPFGKLLRSWGAAHVGELSDLGIEESFCGRLIVAELPEESVIPAADTHAELSLLLRHCDTNGANSFRYCFELFCFHTELCLAMFSC